MAVVGGVAQLGERRVRNAEVVSSILILSTTKLVEGLQGGQGEARAEGQPVAVPPHPETEARAPTQQSRRVAGGRVARRYSGVSRDQR